MHIDRSSPSDARRVTEKLLPDRQIRIAALRFLGDAILYANKLDASNWNLNLSKNGDFVRLNTGHEYCVELFEDYISVLCLKFELRSIPDLQELSIEYKGYVGSPSGGSRIVISDSIDDVPDCLVRVPGSVACHIGHHCVADYLPKIRQANQAFIRVAITKMILLPAMRNAHSDGMIDYMSSVLRKRIPKPKYVVSEEEYDQAQEAAEGRAKQLSDSELLARIAESVGERRLVEVKTPRFDRNPYVAEYAKRRANGICQDCHQAAPFVVKRTGEPYLEVHHVVPLAKGGTDTPDNVIALCPNCHRRRHYG